MDTKDSSPPSRGIILRAMRERQMSKRELARLLVLRQPHATFDAMHSNVKRWTRAQHASSPDPLYARLLADILDVSADAIVKQRAAPGDALRRENERLRRELAASRREAGGS